MRRSKRTAALRVAALVVFFATGTAAAQDDDVERTALARSLFRQGVELSDAGRWPEAAEHFRRSLSLRGSPIVEFNLATALTHTGRLVEATELFRRASRDAEAPERLRQAARQQIDALAPRLGRLTVEVEGPLGSVELRMDGDVLPPEGVGVAAPADPGHHVLVALRGEGRGRARRGRRARGRRRLGPRGGAASAHRAGGGARGGQRGARRRLLGGSGARGGARRERRRPRLARRHRGRGRRGRGGGAHHRPRARRAGDRAPVEGNLGPAVIVFE
ncbi:MAG: hypothetical protein M5U28_07435 [Sandaracinaceae bacterium]|nr:hypothetical protein [Sandaracinaceae bacterium]